MNCCAPTFTLPLLFLLNPDRERRGESKGKSRSGNFPLKGQTLKSGIERVGGGKFQKKSNKNAGKQSERLTRRTHRNTVKLFDRTLENRTQQTDTHGTLDTNKWTNSGIIWSPLQNTCSTFVVGTLTLVPSLTYSFVASSSDPTDFLHHCCGNFARSLNCPF